MTSKETWISDELIKNIGYSTKNLVDYVKAIGVLLNNKFLK